MASAPHLVRSAGLTGYVEVARAAGLDPLAMLRKAGLPRGCLDDPEMMISVEAATRLLDRSAAAAGMEEFGLRMASRRRLSDLGPVGLVMRQEATALGALRVFLSYLRLVNDSLQASIEQEGRVAVIREQLMLPGSIPMRQSLELAVGALFQVLRELLGPGWRAQSVCFSHRPPRDAGFHRSYFGRSVEFNADFNGIVCASRDLEAELRPAEPGLASFARRMLDAELSRRAPGIGETVRHLIAASLGSGRCTVDKVALHLGMSRQTLHRRLAAEGQTFSSLLDSVRTDAASRLQHESDQPLGEVAAMLGFSSASAFAHWYRAGTGTSFVRSRRSQRALTRAVGNLPV